MRPRVPRGYAFRRALFGYSRIAVDDYAIEAEEDRKRLHREIGRLRRAELLASDGDDIAELLTSFAASVAALRDRVAADAERTLSEAEAYARGRRAEADRAVEEADARARAIEAQAVREARAGVVALAEKHRGAAEALDGAAHAVDLSRSLLADGLRPPASTPRMRHRRPGPPLDDAAATPPTASAW